MALFRHNSGSTSSQGRMGFNMNKSQQRLQALRDEIDATDHELVQLLLKRRQVAAAIGQVKRELGQPLYVPAREQQLIEARRLEAEQLGLAPDLVEDVLRRIMRESYQQQQAADVHLQDKIILIVGGAGALGRLFGRLFEAAGATVRVLDKDDWDDVEGLVDGVDLVLVATPIAITNDIIAQLPDLPKNCILADLTSIKQQPLSAMLAHHHGPVVGLHPMFGPQQKNLAKQLIVVTHGRDPEAYHWVLDALCRWGAHIHQIEAAEHDQSMAFIQVLRHLSTFAYGIHLANENAQVDQLLALSSPIYRLELMMVGRLFAQNGELYADIILANPDNFAMVRRYLATFASILERLENGDKSGFIADFERIQAYFGEFSQRFLEDSQRLLDAAGDAQQII